MARLTWSAVSPTPSSPRAVRFDRAATRGDGWLAAGSVVASVDAVVGKGGGEFDGTGGAVITGAGLPLAAPEFGAATRDAPRAKGLTSNPPRSFSIAGSGGVAGS